MRLHHLELCAFGPFPSKERVDFDTLNEAGLFLLSGPTGAGKSTIFDAICFALYGSTTRPENTKSLYSDFAKPGTEPYVDLELTVGGHRYRIHRTPEWARPSTRAKSGWVTEHPQVALYRCLADDAAAASDTDWEVLSVRNDEAGRIVSEAFGLTREQFAQVVMLPQGQFARFLSASSDDREKLLRRLFPVDLYSDVRDLLKQRSDSAAQRFRDLSAEVRRGHEEVTALLERLSLAEESEPDQADDMVFVDMQSAVDRLERARAQAATARGHAGEQASKAGRHADAVERGIGEWREHDRLVARRTAVQDAEQRTARDRQTEERAAASIPVHEARERLRQTRQQAADKQNQLEDLLARARTLTAEPVAAVAESESEREVERAYWASPDQADSEEYDALLERRRETVGELLRRIRDAEELETTLLEPVRRKTEAETQLLRVAEQEKELGQTRERLVHERDELSEAISNLPEAAAAESEASRVLELTRRAQGTRDDLGKASQDAERAESRRKEASGHYDDLMSRRFRQAVMVLADDLQAEQPCPVCGSTEHPDPARAETSGSDHMVSEEDLERSARERDRSDALAKETFARCAELRRALEELESQGARPRLSDAEEAAREARERHRKVHDQKQRCTDIEGRLDSLWQEIRDAESRSQELRVEISGLDSTIQELKDRRANLSSALDDVPSREELGRIRARIEKLREHRSAADRLRGHVQGLRENEHAAETDLAREVAESVFDDADEAERHWLPPQELAVLRERLRASEVERARIDEAWKAAWHEAMLERIEAGESRPDPEDAERTRRAAEEARKSYEDELARETTFREGLSTVERIRSGDRDLQAQVQQASDTARMLKDLADVASGLGGENLQRMSLTTFVLAAQLEEIAEAATIRLKNMTNGRYSLRHSDASAGRNRKSGLGLEIFDSWTSETRSTSSLSGGETFMASLCLALGLADVVQARAGGIEVDTLFVDEGFGSLDEDTLEDVMDAIDGLRENGRVIGLVSHVADMKTRIPEHVRITRSPSGSSLESKST